MTPIFAAVDGYILAFSAITVVVTIWMGFRSAKQSKTASDFFVAGRSVSVGWNASAISGEYLSAASFMGIAGMVMSSGYDALWYPVCYACGYLFLLLFIAGPLRRFGAYTIPDFAEGRYDSPVFRKIAVCFVLFIGFFYTMPQMKGAGTTLAYIFPGLPYWAGVVLVGAVITLNVALGGMKGITLVQAFQYWAKMFAISVPIFVLMAVYGHYGKQLGANGNIQHPTSNIQPSTNAANAVLSVERFSLPEKSKAPNGSIAVSTSVTLPVVDGWVTIEPPSTMAQVEQRLKELAGKGQSWRNVSDAKLISVLMELSEYEGRRVVAHTNLNLVRMLGSLTVDQTNRLGAAAQLRSFLASKDVGLLETRAGNILAVQKNQAAGYSAALQTGIIAQERFFPQTWKITAINGNSNELYLKYNEVKSDVSHQFGGRSYPFGDLGIFDALREFSEQNGFHRMLVAESAQFVLGMTNKVYVTARFSKEEWQQDARASLRSNGVDVIVASSALVVVPSAKHAEYEAAYQARGMLAFEPEQATIRQPLPEKAPKDATWLSPFGPLTTKAAKAAKLSPEEAKPYSLLYTYSLIIALICGTAGLPHILVRFYTNPDGGAAKRTTMWVMILIGIFYVFPPVFGVMGRNLFPELYNGIGAKGTDKIVLELPRLLNEKYAPLGSILSGITCAGAFAAFMSTFSGLLVSMTGALAHDVYGRMLRPKATPEQRMRMFKYAAVLIGFVSILLGSLVEPLEINFMVGQAFAIAAASYFPLLFMSVWWRGMTMRGAAVGMLTGGLCALVAAMLTNVSNLALDKGPMGKIFAGFAGMNDFWAHHPLLRILCEQPAIWTVPLAITLMIVVSKATRKEVPADVRMKMLVLHAPEKLGLKQEYIQEHQAGH